jgi:hypothetical protein
MEIERLEIGRLVVDAEEAAIGDADGFARTVEAELRRMVNDAAWTPPAGDAAIGAVDAGSFEWSPAEGESRLARQVAERIVHAIPRAARR